MKTTSRFLTHCVLLGFLLLSAQFVQAHQGTEEMMRAARAFLDGLRPEQRTKATYALTNAERENWWFVPRDRNGLTLGEMTEAQQKLAHELLKSGLSQRGYAKATAIMALEVILKEIGDAPQTRDPVKYYFTIFGTPSASTPWGWRVEGHHVSLNFTIIDHEHVQVTPSFFGSNPAEVRTGAQQGLRVLGEEEDLGRLIAKSLTDEQKKTGILTIPAPRDIVTSNSRTVSPLSPTGLPVSQMTPEQSQQLLALVKLYIERFRSEIGDEALAKINQAGWEKVGFAWAGGLERGNLHYYRIQGPTFLVEYDNTQGNGNHVHSVWRDFAGDFGRDLLREHYAKDHPAAP